MHDKYISSDESYQEYLDRLDNEILLRSRDRKIEEANNEIDHLLKKTKENIVKYIKMQFHEDISNFIRTLSKQQILDIQDCLFDYTSIEELKNSVKKTSITTIDAFYFIYLSKNQQVHILVTVQEIQLFEVLLEFHREFLHCLHELYDNDILMLHFLVSLNVLFVDLSYNF